MDNQNSQTENKVILEDLPDDSPIDTVIIWADLDNYTSISKFLTEKYRLKKFMEEFYEKIDDCVTKTDGGRREKFVGDGVLIIIPIMSKVNNGKNLFIKDLDDPRKLGAIMASYMGIKFAITLKDDFRRWFSSLPREGDLKTWEEFLEPVLQDKPLQLIIGIHKGRILKIKESPPRLRYEICGSPINIVCSLTSLDKFYPGTIFISEKLAKNLEILKDTSKIIKNFQKGTKKLRGIKLFFRYT